MKLFLLIFTFNSAILIAENCPIPLSWAGKVVFIEDEPQIPDPVRTVTQTSRTAVEISTAVSTVTSIGPTQVAQGARALAFQDMLSCGLEDTRSQGPYGPLAWSDSPTQLFVGDTQLKYHLGAVVGNWLFLGVITSGILVLKQISEPSNLIIGKALKVIQSHFPGELVLPALFLLQPTVQSSTTLLREGAAGERFIGALSLLGMGIGTGSILYRLSPQRFYAYWDQKELGWKNLIPNTPYLERYGTLFEDYQEHAHRFILAESAISLATGALASFHQASPNNCNWVLWSSGFMNLGYTFLQIALKPNVKPRERLFYAGIAALQGIALITQATAQAVAKTEETINRVRTVTSSIMMATEWALFAKGLFDLGSRLYSGYRYFWTSKTTPIAGGTILPVLTDKQFSTLVPPVLIQEDTPPGVSSEVSSLESI